MRAGMEEQGRQMAPAARRAALESWRIDVLRGMLTAGAIGAPPIVLTSVLFGSSPLGWTRVAVLSVAALGFPLLRLAPGLSLTVRASLAIALAFATGVFALSTFGFSSGPGIVLAGTGILAVVFLGRVSGYLLIALSVAAYFVVGNLASRGAIAIPAVQLDPGEIRNWSRMGITFAFLALLLTTAIDFIIRHVERSSRAAAEALVALHHAYERLALLHDRFDAAKEEERRYIAHELHDELGQVLTVVKLRLRMGAGPGSGPGAGDGIGETLALVDGVIERVRKISTDLRPPLLDEVGLWPALRAHIDAQAALSGVAITLETEGGDPGRLDPGLEIACFRVVQESLTNALRHAAAHQITVRLVRRPKSIAITIIDDGRGFDTAALDALSAGHLGVMGMQERVRARGGRLHVSSRPGAGATVAVEIPLTT